MNRAHSLAILVLGALSLAACAEDAAPRRPLTKVASTTKSTTSATAPAGAITCPEPTRLVADASATSLQIVGDQVYYLATGKVMRVGLDGGTPVQVFASPTLLHAYVDAESLVTIEGPEPTEEADEAGAIVRVHSLAAEPAEPTVVVHPTWSTAGTRVVGADGASFYLVAVEETGEALYQLTHDDAPALTQLAGPELAVVTSTEITTDALWYVRGGAQVFRRPFAGEATEHFEVDAAGCDIAVAGERAFCIRADAIEQRDLDGKNPTTLFDLARSKSKVGFAAGVTAGGSLVLRSADEGVVRILDLPGATESILACGRPAVGDVAAMGTKVVWTEQSGGVWLAQR